MIRISFNTSDQRIVAALKIKAPQIISALVRKLTILMIRLQRRIVTEKLSGQVLHHRTGKLAGSIVAHPAEVRGSTISASVTGAGGSMAAGGYGRVHERGGTRAYEIVPVNKQALRFMLGGKEVFAKSVTHPPLPARPFMRPAIEEMKNEIISELQQTVGTLVKE